ncbi:hypothetical protein DEIPH_ctg032orf0069 [Deinococcus phoenicis]|uniref:Uncharacterized protein n=1 Tax=Deinococcus phoenicis TaxID=1476583 RepID=A0A016QP17_9DEIO|nr:hypothetical protein [Deinococcus phoenicis]EYB67823.1 hypothetical protein DEIPH_ctg032orf0069 [Deinococcus phoenicis]
MADASLRPWMLEAPRVKLPEAAAQAFQAALMAREPGLLPEGVPRWIFLDGLARQGFLLHGSARGDLTGFEPRTPHDLSPDEFSKRTGVFAASDGLWAMMYALRDRSRVARMLNMALQVQEAGGGWSSMRYFLSLAPRGPAVTDGRDLLSPGFVYVLPPEGFEQMPPYGWPGLGTVREPHWVSPNPVRPRLCVPVMPGDFPLPVRTHDAARVDALARLDPWGFPWLDPSD